MYHITSAFSAKFIPINIFEIAVMVQKLQHILMQVTEDGFDHGGLFFCGQYCASDKIQKKKR